MRAERAARDCPSARGQYLVGRADFGKRNKSQRLWNESNARPARSFAARPARSRRKAGALHQKRKRASVFLDRRFPEAARIIPKASTKEMWRRPPAIAASTFPPPEY